MTEEEFFSLVVGQHNFRGVSDGYVTFTSDPPMIAGFDGCNGRYGPLVFEAGEVKFVGMEASEASCPDVELYGTGWVFGAWMVEPDGSVVVINSLNGKEHPVPEVVVPSTTQP